MILRCYSINLEQHQKTTCFSSISQKPIVWQTENKLYARFAMHLYQIKWFDIFMVLSHYTLQTP